MLDLNKKQVFLCPESREAYVQALDSGGFVKKSTISTFLNSVLFL
jgi:hypothetical protein